MSLSVLLIGLSLGASYALFALGYSLVYSVLGSMNLAHGDVLVAGTYVTLVTAVAGVPAPLAVAAGVVAAAVTGAAVDLLAYRPLRFARDPVLPLVAGLGAALILRNLITEAEGTNEATFPSLLPEAGITANGVTLSFAALGALALAVGIAVLVERFLSRTRAGWATQAVAQDLAAARLVGVPVSGVILGVYAAAGAVGALGGILYASTLTTLKVSLGFAATVQAFTAAVIGGITSLRGAVVGGVALGLIHAFTAYYLDSSYRDVATFLILIAVLVVAPGGLLGTSRVSSAETYGQRPV